ncbi:hypothetical protein [Microbacterium sp. SMR1]|uniref:hypothetical protein n=1 Tax=Microbacterium sp. SMR1 TaxID=1497340 RepID=UPI000DCC5DF6|nr:hypothetical protein [Microbacterium sp. SMR1]RAZ30716.1 hypothetical protein DO944_14430 [Microbacterium sp. SMR1]
MTTLGIIFAAAFAASLIWGRRGVLVVLASTVAFNSSAAVVAGDVVVTPFYMGLLLYLPLAVFARAREGRSGRVIGVLLMIFFLYSAVVTLFAPLYFEGIGVFAPGVGIDEQVGALTPLRASLSNIAQVAYLGMNVLFIYFNERNRLLNISHVSTGLGVGVIVGVIAFVAWRTGLPWPYELFDNSPRGFYARNTVRLRAQFAEPSQLGGFSLTATAYFVARMNVAQTVRAAWAAGLFAILAGVLLAASASGTAVVGAVISTAGFLLLNLIRFIRQPRPRRIRVSSFLICLAAIVAVAAISLPLLNYVLGTVDGKVGGASWVNRNASNLHGLQLVWETSLLGVGLGSNRASSLLVLLLSTIGVIGTACFVIISVRAVRNSIDDARFPATVALVAFLCAAFVSLADFAAPYMWLMLAVCLPTQNPPHHVVLPEGHVARTYGHTAAPTRMNTTSRP